MNRAAEAVLTDALQLDPAERAAVAAALLASLDGPADADVAAAWDAEIDRRLAAIDAGTMPLHDWPDVRRRIEREILGQ